MDAREINEWFYTLPEIIHVMAFALLIACYAHLFLGFWKVKNRIKKHVIFYFLIRFFIVIFYLFAKVEDEFYGMFDLFFPLYLITYIDGLIVLKGHSFHRCQDIREATKKLTNFQSRKKHGS